MRDISLLEIFISIRQQLLELLAYQQKTVPYPLNVKNSLKFLDPHRDSDQYPNLIVCCMSHPTPPKNSIEIKLSY